MRAGKDVPLLVDCVESVRESAGILKWVVVGWCLFLSLSVLRIKHEKE